MEPLRSKTLGPMYYRIEQDLLEEIECGNLTPGSQIPSETELAKKYNVSRITAKRVLDDLVQLGRAYRQQGKGTFVSPERIREVSGFRSFSEDLHAMGLHPTSIIIRFEEIEPTLDIKKRLMLNKYERAYLLKRVRLTNEEPVAIEMAFLPTNLFPGLLSEDLTSKSLYEIFREKYRVFPVWADAEIESSSADKELASYLKIKQGHPVLIAHRRTYNETYIPIEITTSIYRGDKFSFSVDRQYIG